MGGYAGGRAASGVSAVEARRELARRELVRRRVFRDGDLPFLISLMRGSDQNTGERFGFEAVREPLEPGEVVMDGNRLVARDKSWRWQRYIVDRLLDENRVIFLKGRQIGVTWIVLAVDVAEAITRPGTASLVFRQVHNDAIDNVRRWWVLYQSLPEWLTGHIKVIKPQTADRPSIDGVTLKFPDGSFSEILPMSSAASSGHGRTVRHVLLDEAAHIESLAGIGAAVAPAAGRKARISIVSTANGRHNPETGEGNEFHRRWTDTESGYFRIFLPYDVHPDRNELWYETASEVREMKVWQRQEQYPRNEIEAFALSDRSFFDQDGMLEYAERTKNPVRRYDFDLTNPREAKISEHDRGRVRVFAEPESGHEYAIGADVATGRGVDYSAAYVVDLATMEFVAEYHARVEADIYARDLHFLGKRYEDALIAVETAGGFGEAVIIALRDGVAGRPRYPRLYRHVLSSRPDKPVAKPYGFPTNQKTRPLVLNQMEQHLRERTFPWLSEDLLYEMSEFVMHDHGTSPRARDGSRDDRVMACAIALEMYRLYGAHRKRKRRATAKSEVWLDLGGQRPRRKRGSRDETPWKNAA